MGKKDDRGRPARERKKEDLRGKTVRRVGEEKPEGYITLQQWQATAAQKTGGMWNGGGKKSGRGKRKTKGSGTP